MPIPLTAAQIEAISTQAVYLETVNWVEDRPAQR